jgi:hypothetical protein
MVRARRPNPAQRRVSALFIPDTGGVRHRAINVATHTSVDVENSQTAGVARNAARYPAG